jgi:hypothetical protein
MAQISPKFCQDVLYKFKILSNITRPSFTAIKIVENYHQVEPCRPLWKWLSHYFIAIPMLALLRAGASLHHHRSSTNWSFACSAFIILIFVH